MKKRKTTFDKMKERDRKIDVISEEKGWYSIPKPNIKSFGENRKRKNK